MKLSQFSWMILVLSGNVQAGGTTAPSPLYHTLQVDWLGGESDRTNHIIHPNEQLEVCVKYEAGSTIEVHAAGQTGVVVPGLDGVRAPLSPNALTTRTVIQPIPSQQAQTTCWTFAPFRAGEVWVEIVETGKNGTLALTAADRERLYACRDAVKPPEKDPAQGLTLKNAEKSSDPRAEVLLKKCDQLVAQSKERKGVEDKLQALKPDATEQTDALTKDKNRISADIASTTASLDSEATVLRSDLADEGVVRKERHLLLVEQTNVGAIRFGVAGILGAVSNTWEAQTIPPTETVPSNIAVVQTRGGKYDMELVTSYTHYIWPQPESSTDFRVGVTLGFGVADLTDAKIALGSTYLGLDLGWRQFSITPTLVLRRLDYLAEGMSVGQQVADTNAILLRSEWTPGVGIIIQAPLELFGIPATPKKE